MTTIDDSVRPITHSNVTVDAPIATLRTRARGEVLTPGDTGYDAARAGFNLHYDQRPAIIVVASDPNDVAHGVRFAAEHDLRVTVRATGHGPGRECDGAVMINTSNLTDVKIDPVARTATVGGGAKWAAVLPLAQEHGLAPLLGSTTDVGAVGYTLGGGMGWLARKHGLSSDAVRAFELVTPDGTVIRCSATELPEMFWALKGGGAGTLGVVTEMEIDLFPVEVVYGGNLFYPIEDAREVVGQWREWARDADTDLTSSVCLINFPPIDLVPEPFRGRSFAIVRGCWAGNLDEGKALVDAWRAWRTPEIDMWGPLPFAAVDAISMDPTDPVPAMVTTEWFADMPDDEAVDIVVAATAPQPGQPPMVLFAEFRHGGGAMSAGAAAAANDRGRSGEVLLEL
ncbi:MAG TPA: FAD-binding oxidoreductase, partial [Aldersonia sp.]